MTEAHLTIPDTAQQDAFRPAPANPDIQLLKEAREYGCNDDLVLRLAARVEALRGGMAAIKQNPSLASCQIIATQSLEG